jgi:hypothetical protein
MSLTPRRYDSEQVRRFSDTTIAFAAAARAHELIENGTVIGKLLLKP